MKLHYFNGKGTLTDLVLIKDDRRIELHVRAIGESSYMLVSQAGGATTQPERHKCQGPFARAAQAEAVLRGIAGSLLLLDFQPRPDLLSIWSVQAQRLARDIRREREANPGSFVFDPEPIV